MFSSSQEGVMIQDVTKAQLLQWHWPLPASSKFLGVALPVSGRVRGEGEGGL